MSEWVTVRNKENSSWKPSRANSQSLNEKYESRKGGGSGGGVGGVRRGLVAQRTRLLPALSGETERRTPRKSDRTLERANPQRWLLPAAAAETTTKAARRARAGAGLRHTGAQRARRQRDAGTGTSREERAPSLTVCPPPPLTPGEPLPRRPPTRRTPLYKQLLLVLYLFIYIFIYFCLILYCSPEFAKNLYANV